MNLTLVSSGQTVTILHVNMLHSLTIGALLQYRMDSNFDRVSSSSLLCIPLHPLFVVIHLCYSAWPTSTPLPVTTPPLFLQAEILVITSLLIGSVLRRDHVRVVQSVLNAVPFDHFLFKFNALRLDHPNTSASILITFAYLDHFSSTSVIGDVQDAGLILTPLLVDERHYLPLCNWSNSQCHDHK